MSSLHVVPDDPGVRFAELYEALEEHRGMFGDVNSVRYAALTAVTIPGAATDVAAAIRKTADALRDQCGWFDALRGSLRFIVSAILVQAHDDARDFLEEVDRVNRMFRDEGLRNGGFYETLAVLILRIRRDLALITPADVARFKALYEEMKGHHWWLTGPDDYPACALLVHEDGDAATIGARAESIYQGLRERGFSSGDPLQTAANILVLSDDPAPRIADRFLALAEELRTHGKRIWPQSYDEVAILTFTKESPRELVERTLRHADGVATLRPRPHKVLAFNLATNLTFLDSLAANQRLKGVADAKSMMDLQAMLNQQAAIAASASASAALIASTT
jgi:hypothetical protein